MYYIKFNTTSFAFSEDSVTEEDLIMLANLHYNISVKHNNTTPVSIFKDNTLLTTIQ